MKIVETINIYSKSKSEVGRWLSNFTYCPIETEDGHFDSIEGYWYWLTRRDDSLRTVSGWSAKELGKKLSKVTELEEEQFKNKICKALDLKIKTRPKWLVEQVKFPLEHYYEYGGKKVYKPEYDWIIEHIEKRIEQLREFYENTNTK